jgi:hypothetical protein
MTNNIPHTIVLCLKFFLKDEINVVVRCVSFLVIIRVVTVKPAVCAAPMVMSGKLKISIKKFSSNKCQIFIITR